MIEGLLIRRERINQNMSQQALCEGICTASYLSKIESGQTRCSEEMYAALFDALGIVYETDAALLSAFDAAFSDACERMLRMETDEESEVEALLALSGRLRHSPRGVDASLARCLLAEDGAPEEAAQLAELSAAFDARQTLLYALARERVFMHAGDWAGAADSVLAVRGMGEAYVYWRLSCDFFRMGDYGRSAENGEEAYRLYAAQGHAQAMLGVAMALAATYANGMDAARMRRWHAVSRNLNRTVGDDVSAEIIHYNEGASCLMFGEYAEGLRHLRAGEALARALAARDPDQADMYYQKLAFACVLNGEMEAAREAMARIRRDPPEGSLKASLALLAYMLSTPDFQRSRAYCALLEDCFAAAEGEARGRLEFYGYFLIGAYKATRQYRKAVQLMEKYKLSHLFGEKAKKYRD